MNHPTALGLSPAAQAIRQNLAARDAFYAASGPESDALGEAYMDSYCLFDALDDTNPENAWAKLWAAQEQDAVAYPIEESGFDLAGRRAALLTIMPETLRAAIFGI